MPSNHAPLGSHARNAVSELQMEAQLLGQKAQERAHELTDTARERARSFQHDLEDRIVDNPVKSILVAAGVGLLLGLVCRR